MGKDVRACDGEFLPSRGWRFLLAGCRGSGNEECEESEQEPSGHGGRNKIHESFGLVRGGVGFCGGRKEFDRGKKNGADGSHANKLEDVFQWT